MHHSMGASTAVLFAHRHGHLVKHLVLQSPSVCEVPLEFRLQIALRIPFLRELLCLLIIPRIGEGACEDNPAAIRSSFRLLMTRLRSGGSWGMGDEGRTCAMLNEIEGARNEPVLVLWGECDTVCEIKEAEIVKRLAPTALLYTHPEADHSKLCFLPWSVGLCAL
jgi:pimeloyl-ACP methyl ester carboxylesterase